MARILLAPSPRATADALSFNMACDALAGGASLRHTVPRRRGCAEQPIRIASIPGMDRMAGVDSVYHKESP
jgi:hypothetical protein